jgi:hypothetical protein
MKLAIVGSRTFTDYLFLESTIMTRINKNVTEIVSGGAPGADSLAEDFAKKFHLKMKVFPADWKGLGKKAGYLRNISIIEYSDIVIAFWDFVSPGTKSSINIAYKMHKELHIIDVRTNKNGVYNENI